MSTDAGRRRRAPLRPGTIGAQARTSPRASSTTSRPRASSPGTSWAARATSPRSSASAAPPCARGYKLLTSGNLIRATKGPGGGIFVAHTAEQGISRSLSDAIAMMLDTGSASLDELLDARMVLEVPLAGRAAHRPDAETVAALRAAVRREEESDGDPEALAAADAEVHRTVAAAAGNRMLEALTGWIFEVLQPSLSEKLADAIVHSAVVEQHDALLAAVEKGDPPRAERAMKDHLLYLRDVLRMVEGAP